jgi:hypothetical protein
MITNITAAETVGAGFPHPEMLMATVLGGETPPLPFLLSAENHIKAVLN